MKLNVNEIFYSLQGEGARSGEASIFIRLTKCNLACSFCDTDFAQGVDMTLEEIYQEIQKYSCKWIIWTGGEPTIQLNEECVQFFRNKGYLQAIETNGTRPVPTVDYITCSPKLQYKQIKIVVSVADEVRIPLAKGDTLPDIDRLPKAKKYFVSPIFDGNFINRDNVDYCVDLVKTNSAWSLSLQVHKLIHIE